MHAASAALSNFPGNRGTFMLSSAGSWAAEGSEIISLNMDFWRWYTTQFVMFALICCSFFHIAIFTTLLYFCFFCRNSWHLSPALKAFWSSVWLNRCGSITSVHKEQKSLSVFDFKSIFKKKLKQRQERAFVAHAKRFWISQQQSKVQQLNCSGLTRDFLHWQATNPNN